MEKVGDENNPGSSLLGTDDAIVDLYSGERISLEKQLGDSRIAAFPERIKEERSDRLDTVKSRMSFGVSFLDDALNGIYDNDLVVIGASSGLGKTQLAVSIALENVKKGKRVHYFALEASKLEIERRIKYEYLAELFFRSLRTKHAQVHLNYTDWADGLFDAELGQYEPEIEEHLSIEYKSLVTIYRGSKRYGVEDFAADFAQIEKDTDLVIIDHLHYFDWDNPVDAVAIREVVKMVRSKCLDYGKPAILISHLRRADRGRAILVPGQDEFHGSSDIPKIATKVITIAPCFEEVPFAEGLSPTFIRIAKNRAGGERTRHIGVLAFDHKTQHYRKGYYLGVIKNDEKFHRVTETAAIPKWASKNGMTLPDEDKEEDNQGARKRPKHHMDDR